MTCVYNKNLLVPILDQYGSVNERAINLIIINSKDSLQIKVRDPSEYIFNYTEIIDLGDYEILRNKQNLDINFNEFAANILEMLQQVQKKEMFIKCEIAENVCTLVFYNKSKIKSIIYLTLDLHATNQNEILNEVMSSMNLLKESNGSLQLQITNLKKLIVEKDKERNFFKNNYTKMESQVYAFLKEIENSISTKTKEIECILLRKLKILMQRIGPLVEEMKTLKMQSAIKIDSSCRLLKNLEELRLENNKKNNLIDQLKSEKHELHVANSNLERNLSNLRQILNEKDALNRELQTKNEELKSDMEKATIIIAQKKSAYDELCKDLVQANQMLVNFNNHYDLKVKALENLQSTLASRNQIIEQKDHKYNELQREFDNYKVNFNFETQEKLKHDLFLAKNKIEELEKSVRNTKKINALLSEKVNRIGI